MTIDVVGVLKIARRIRCGLDGSPASFIDY